MLKKFGATGLNKGIVIVLPVSYFFNDAKMRFLCIFFFNFERILNADKFHCD